MKLQKVLPRADQGGAPSRWALPSSASWALVELPWLGVERYRRGWQFQLRGRELRHRQAWPVMTKGERDLWHALHDQVFPTRREALQVLAAILELHVGPGEGKG